MRTYSYIIKALVCFAFMLTSLDASGQAIDGIREIEVIPGEGKTVAEALREAREMRRLDTLSVIKDIHIRLQSGMHMLNETLSLRPEDSGITFVGEEGACISGGVRIDGWKQEGNLWVADVPDFNGRPLEFRQLWVNGLKATRARDVEIFERMNRIISVDKQRREIWVPAKAVEKILDVPYVEMILHEMWCVSVLRIKSVHVSGDSAAVRFHEPESRIQFEHPWPSPMVTTDGHNSPFYLTNSLALLDRPGEWYLDIRASKLYYMPREGEDMTKAAVVAPMMETLVKVEGTPDDRVRNVTFHNISFLYTTWRRPSFQGHVPLQAGMYLTDAYKLRPQMVRVDNHKLDNQGWLGRAAAAVQLSWTENVKMEQCAFKHLGGSGLDFIEGDQGCTVTYCIFDDIAMNGCVMGSFSPEAHETHRPYHPADTTVICRDNTIQNSYFHDVTNDDWGCVAIAAGYVAGTNICHNEISEVSYTGISLGWGWNRNRVCMHDNRVQYNLIHHYARHMYDVAGIYTLGNQPGTIISNNVVRDIYKPSYVHDPNHWFYLYTDEGSSNITVRDNWCPDQKFLQNANGPGNVWENNGPISGDFIMNAGIKKERKYTIIPKFNSNIWDYGKSVDSQLNTEKK